MGGGNGWMRPAPWLAPAPNKKAILERIVVVTESQPDTST